MRSPKERRYISLPKLSSRHRLVTSEKRRMSLRRFSIIFLLLISAMAVSAQENSPKPEASADPISYGFVIDNSGSFRKLLEDVIQFIGKVLDEQKPGDETFFVRFIDTEKIKLDQELT